MLRGFSPCSQSGAARARIHGGLRRARRERAFGQHLAKSLATAGTMQLLRGANARLTPAAHRVLDEPILAGVVGDHGEHTARVEPVAQRGKRALECRELVVDGDPHGLKKSRELAWARARTVGAANRVDQIVAHAYGLPLAPTRDFPREPVGARFVSVVAKNLG